jgi:hypothetical protein
MSKYLYITIRHTTEQKIKWSSVRTALILKTIFIVPTDAHYYKIIEMLNNLKLYHLLRHVSVHAGTIIREQSCA